MYGAARQRHGFNAVAAADVVDFHRRAFIGAAVTPGDHQRHAQGARRHQGDGDALGFHGEHQVGLAVVVLLGEDFADELRGVRLAGDIRSIQKTARQHPARFLQPPGQRRKRLRGALPAHRGAKARPASSPGYGFQRTEVKAAESLGHQVDVLADGGFGGVKQLAELPQRVYAVGRVGQHARNGAQALVSLDLVHGEPSCPEDFCTALHYNSVFRDFLSFSGRFARDSKILTLLRRYFGL